MSSNTFGVYHCEECDKTLYTEAAYNGHLSKHGGGHPPDEDARRLRELYWDKEMSTAQIAEELGCSPNGVRYRMEKYDIERRGYSESIEVACEKGVLGRTDDGSFVGDT